MTFMCKGGLIEKNMAEWTRSYSALAINPSRFHQDAFAKTCQRMQLPVKATIFRTSGYFSQEQVLLAIGGERGSRSPMTFRSLVFKTSAFANSAISP